MGTTIRAMLNTDRESKSGYYPLVIRVIHRRQKKLVYTDLKIRIEDFDSDSECVILIKGSPFTRRQVDEMNCYIRGQKRSLEQTLDRLTRKQREFSTSDIVGCYMPNRDDNYFFVFAARDIASKESAGKYGTAELYRSTLSSFRSFGAKEKLKFRDITYSMICDYADYLRAKSISNNTIHMYLRNLRALYNRAKKQGVELPAVSSFTDIKMNTMPTIKRALSREDIKAISALNISADPTLDRARDVFMFSFYTRGMSFVDMVFLKRSDISGGVIYYRRNKTQQNLQVMVTPQLQSIIEKYRSDSPYVLPFLNAGDNRSLYTQYKRALFKINYTLKDLGSQLGIETPLTTYVARHSWATVAKELGGSIAEISEGLGHTTEKTTQIYLKAFDSSVIDRLNQQVANL